VLLIIGFGKRLGQWCRDVRRITFFAPSNVVPSAPVHPSGPILEAAPPVNTPAEGDHDAPDAIARAFCGSVDHLEVIT
jgi:hypothetical protein